jgi:plasmid maintenance system killer protein
MLVRNPIPAGLRFEKLKGCSHPDIYTIHVTGNYKISFEIADGTAYLRRVASHDEIDARP